MALYKFDKTKEYNVGNLHQEILAANLPLATGTEYCEYEGSFSWGNGVTLGDRLIIVMNRELTEGELTQLQTVLDNHQP